MRILALWVDPNANAIAGYASSKKKNFLGAICSAGEWCSGYYDSLRRGWELPAEIYQATKAWNDSNYRVNSHGNQIGQVHPALMIDEWIKLGCPDPVPHRVWPKGKSWNGIRVEDFRLGTEVENYVPTVVPDVIRLKLPALFSPPLPRPANLEERKKQMGLCF